MSSVEGVVDAVGTRVDVVEDTAAVVRPVRAARLVERPAVASGLGPRVLRGLRGREATGDVVATRAMARDVGAEEDAGAERVAVVSARPAVPCLRGNCH